MRRILAGVLLTAAACIVRAADADARYAVLSLLSDQITVVVRADTTTGSTLDRNRRQELPVPGHSLDKRMVLAMDDALRATGIASPPVLLFTMDPAIFERQAQLLDSGQGAASLLEAVRPVLKGADARYLVIATKYRHEATLRLANGSLGVGTLSGLGFYVDTQMESYERGDAGRTGTGFVAAYAYFVLSLVDLQAGRVVREVPVMGSLFALGFRSETGNPWDAMTAQEKVAALDRLLRTEARRAMPELLKP
jgi:hypothetical protein